VIKFDLEFRGTQKEKRTQTEAQHRTAYCEGHASHPWPTLSVSNASNISHRRTTITITVTMRVF